DGGWSRAGVGSRGGPGGWSHGGAGSGSVGGGWVHGSGGGASSPSGAVNGGRSGLQGGSFAGRGGFGASHFGHGYHPRFIGFRGYPYYFADFGLGFALGLSVLDPWYYDYGPYYAGYYYAPYGPPPGGYYYPAPPTGYAPPPAQAAPPTGDAAPPPAACGSWKWDTEKQTYNWIPCAS
ncbi:MAG: hypothetical protein ACXWKN_15800, partial [Phenylobacterium sp.]